MSKGPGRVQRAIMAAIEAEPGRRWTVEELAAAVYSGEIGRAQTSAVRRAIALLGLQKCRVALPDTFGWRHVIGI